jgi:ferrochelatase
MQKQAILLINLGTPDSPAPNDVHRYLIEFLTDKRVIDIPWLYRQLLVRGVIVPRRYKQSAKSYEAIWTAEGSPLMVWGRKVQRALQARVGDQCVVELAMRYQNPSIGSVLDKLLSSGVEQIKVLPLFPQYASATTGSVMEKVMDEVRLRQVIPELSFVQNFATHPAYIKALSETAAPFDLKDYDHILFSYHGLPERQLIKADCHHHCLKSETCCNRLTEKNRNCYSAQCHATTRAVVDRLSIPSSKYSIAFQSRLGSEPWKRPFTNEVIQQLAKQGCKRLLVFCPSFICDCLETTYEIGVEYGQEFRHAGGEVLDLVPSLNDSDSWIEALALIAGYGNAGDLDRRSEGQFCNLDSLTSR